MIKVLRFSLLGMLAVLGGTASADVRWVKTAPANLQTGDVLAIVDETSARAMSNNNSTSKAPDATEITLSDDLTEITGDVDATLQWVLTVNEGMYQFKVADTENYLYGTDSNNGLRVGTNSNNVFTLSDGDKFYLVNSATNRYVGVYNSQDWRCYTSINSNIQNTVTSFYKKTTAEEPVFEPTDCTAQVNVNGWKSDMGNVGDYTKDVAQKEQYLTNTTTNGQVLYQTVEGLANGTYTVEPAGAVAVHAEVLCHALAEEDHLGIFAADVNHRLHFRMVVLNALGGGDHLLDERESNAFGNTHSNTAGDTQRNAVRLCGCTEGWSCLQQFL